MLSNVSFSTREIQAALNAIDDKLAAEVLTLAAGRNEAVLEQATFKEQVKKIGYGHESLRKTFYTFLKSYVKSSKRDRNHALLLHTDRLLKEADGL